MPILRPLLAQDLSLGDYDRVTEKGVTISKFQKSTAANLTRFTDDLHSAKFISRVTGGLDAEPLQD